MLAAQRRRLILEALNGSGVLSTDEMAEKFSVSTETIRRDVAFLDNAGRLVRVHGGAMNRANGSRVNDEAPFIARVDAHRDAKARIGHAAAALVSDGDIVAIDVGTTSLEIARALPQDFRGLVATPCIRVATELAGRDGLDVLLSGGWVRGGDLACSSAQAVDFFRNLNTDIAFLSSGGISDSAGLTDFHRAEVETRKEIRSHARRAYVVGDASKVGRVAPFRVCALDEVTGLVTDSQPPAPFTETLSKRGVQLVVAEAAG